MNPEDLSNLQRRAVDDNIPAPNVAGVNRRPSGYLDRPQTWGILPTMTFWNRRDVGRIAGAYILPIWMLIGFAASMVAIRVPWWAVPVVMASAGVTMLLLQGLLERYIRQRASRTGGDHRSLPDLDPDQVGPSPSRRKLIIALGMAVTATALMSWQVAARDKKEKRRQSDREARLRRLERQLDQRRAERSQREPRPSR